MSNKFEPLNNPEDVINLSENPDNVLSHHPMFKVDKIIRDMNCRILKINPSNWQHHQDRKKCLNEGVDCEVLNLGATSWKKGKLRIKVSVEFCPDEPESPLDDIRDSINEGNE